jgi:hypothetical protein
MKYSLYLVFGCFFACLVGFDASAKFVNYDDQRIAAATQEAANLTEEDIRTIQTLENDLRILDTEIKKCQNSKKGWTAATVIGSAGVVSTGIAAIVQGVKINEKKSKLEELRKETKAIKTDTENLKQSF